MLTIEPAFLCHLVRIKSLIYYLFKMLYRRPFGFNVSLCNKNWHRVLMRVFLLQAQEMSI